MPDMRISLMKGETIPRDIKGRRIICCFCNDKGTWDTKTLEKFAKRFPEAKEWYLHKLPEQLRYPGQVLFCPGLKYVSMGWKDLIRKFLSIAVR